MNNSINIANTNAAKANDPIASSNTKNTQDRLNSDETDDSGVNAGSFHESIKKAYDESKNSRDTEKTDKNEADQSGNDLPVNAEPAESTANDDRAVLPGGLYLSGQSSPSDKQVKTESTKTSPLTANIDTDSLSENKSNTLLSPLATDKKAEGDGKLTEIPSQLRQLLAAEKDSNAKNTKSGLTRSAKSGEAAVKGGQTTGDTSAAQSSETLTLKTDAAAVADKVTAALTMTGQQSSQTNTQSSILLQTATAPSDTAGNGLSLPGASTSAAAGSSNTNLQPMLPQASISEAFGRPAWAQGMGKQVLMMVNQNISTAEIRLNPAHLGPIEMLIDMKDEQVSVSMSSRHAVVREAMEQALPKLRDMLEQNGFSLADTDISQHSFAQQREQNPQSTSKSFAVSNNDQLVSSEISQQVIRQTTLPSSMVDYYI